MQSTFTREVKAYMGFVYYLLQLVLILHIAGCLHFFFCLTTYEKSSTRLDILQGIGAVEGLDDGTYVLTHPEMDN